MLYPDFTQEVASSAWFQHEALPPYSSLGSRLPAPSASRRGPYADPLSLAAGPPGAPATYVGMCHIFCDSVEAFQAGFGPHAKEIMGDIPNYTDLSPVLQISEVVVG